MTSQEWLAGYLEQGAQEPGPYPPDAASAHPSSRTCTACPVAGEAALPPATFRFHSAVSAPQCGV